MKQNNPLYNRKTSARLTTLAALLVILASALLLPAQAFAQEPGTTVPQPISEPPPGAVRASDLPLPMMGPVDTEADILPLVGPESFVASPETLAAVAPAAYLPVIPKDHALIQADRMGFGTAAKLSNYPDIRSLYAGWYVNWGVKINPERPANIDYMQMIRLHQDLVDGCKNYTTADRNICPYKTPASYTYNPSAAVITAAAKANPGMVWLIGNEIDRVDGFGVGQDEIKPELYAYAYHELYTLVKAADPTARVAIAGMVQFTPSRLEYLNKIWNGYKAIYGVNMPVDVWNVHNFVGSEYCQKEKINGVLQRVCYGMGIPPGSSITPNSKGEERGAYVGEDWRHVYMPTFEKQIRDFRGWMRDHGQINKPLVVTEYGVLYNALCPVDNPATNVNERQQCVNAYGANYVDLENPDIVHEFMLDTFEYFMNAKDCNLSTVDDCRLVQRWAWYSLEDAGWAFNPYTMLYTSGTTQRSIAGDKYSKFAADNVEELQYP